jgi:hypothetical protein
MHAREHRRAVVKLDILPALADVGGIDLKVKPGDQLVTGGEFVVGQNNSPVFVGLTAGVWR